MPVNGKSNGRFELPQFTPLNFSLTEGTDIPPPPASPIEEKPPPIAPIEKEPVESVTNGHANGTVNGATSTNGVYDGRGRTNGASDVKPPMSPASSTRPSSIRRFLSRKSLNTNYENGTNSNVSHEDLMNIDRPESSMSFASGRPEKKSRPNWFRRFTSNNNGGNRTSVIYEEKNAPIIPMGPPAPKLPELSKLKGHIAEDDEGSLGGGEMFKNIK